MGGACDAEITGETAEEIMKKGQEHVHSTDDEVHKEIIKAMENMSEEELGKFNEDFKKKFDEAPEA